jgi:hypothetical protein
MVFNRSNYFFWRITVKKRFLYHLFAIVGVVLLVGLIASCGDKPEEQYRIIEYKPYNAANKTQVWDELWYKHINGKSIVGEGSKPSVIMGQTNYNAMWDLIKPEMAKMPSTAAGLVMVIKVDQYRVIGYVYYEGSERWISANVYNY